MESVCIILDIGRTKSKKTCRFVFEKERINFFLKKKCNFI